MFTLPFSSTFSDRWQFDQRIQRYQCVNILLRPLNFLFHASNDFLQ